MRSNADAGPRAALDVLARHVRLDPLDPLGRLALVRLQTWARQFQAAREGLEELARLFPEVPLRRERLRLPPAEGEREALVGLGAALEVEWPGHAWLAGLVRAAEAARRSDEEGLRRDAALLVAPGALPEGVSRLARAPEGLDLAAVRSPFLAPPSARAALRAIVERVPEGLPTGSFFGDDPPPSWVLGLCVLDVDLGRMAPPDLARLLQALGLARVLDEAHALEALEAAGLAREAGDLLALARGAWLHGEEGRALALLRRASARDPYLLEAHYGRTVLAARAGELEEALRSLRMALLAGWDRPEETRSDPDLEPLRADERFGKALDLAW